MFLILGSKIKKAFEAQLDFTGSYKIVCTYYI